MLCDGQRDCPQGEDENQCGWWRYCVYLYIFLSLLQQLYLPVNKLLLDYIHSLISDPFRCVVSGMYKCWLESKCLPDQQRCDGQRQCRHGDDEWFCDVPCPSSCICHGLYFQCQEAALVQVPEFSRRARTIDLKQNNISSLPLSLHQYTELARLDLSQNVIKDLPLDMLATLSNLLYLDLSSNDVYALRYKVFYGLVRLTTLKLEGNPITNIEPGAFISLANVKTFELKNMNLNTIHGGSFEGLLSVLELDLSLSRIQSLEKGAFSGLESLSRLNISRNSIKRFQKQDFSALKIAFLHSDDYKFCCFVNLGGENCLPAKDEFSSCEDLMSNNVLRSFLWILGSTSLLGNLFVLIWRTIRGEHLVSSYLVKYLALADFVMGIYLIGIASADLYYRGRYIENASTWKKSSLCELLGFLSTTSSEASVFTLLAITVDRFFCIVFPFSVWKLDPQKARTLIILIWLLAALIAAIPLLPFEYFEDKFYSRSGVCVSLHITGETPPGWEYSVAIFHGLNFTIFMMIFMIIFLSYSYMYKVIRGSMKASGRGQGKRDIALARNITLIVLTDFICWVPINIMGTCQQVI